MRMAISRDEMEREYDYKMKEKVQEEEELWAKLCSKLVSNNTPNTPFICLFMFLRLSVMLDQKLLKNRK